MNKYLKITSGIFFILLLVLIGFSVIAYRLLTGPVPIYEGTVEVEHIGAPVKIYRDSFAVPYVFAENENDAAFALGYLHAGERMFQMDMIRRAGEGRLSEVFGEKTINFDKMFRTLNMPAIAGTGLARLDQQSTAFLESYANGVNSYLLGNEGNISIEFDVLGYDPEPWKPLHSLLVMKLLAWELNIGWWADISFAHLVQKFGFDRIKEIIPDYPESAPFVIAGDFDEIDRLPRDLLETERQFREFMGFNGTHIGSNAWVVGGGKSGGMKPIIANDPHLSFQAPGRWYVAVIRSSGFSADGFTLPGIPGVIIGKNNNISWGLTNLMADDTDFYAEFLDSTNTKYFFDGEWKDLIIRKDTIMVKDGAPVEFECRETHRGPIVSPVHPYNHLYSNEYQNFAPLSMRWTAREYFDEFSALRGINRASDWEEFSEAVKLFAAPGQNFLYSDREDNIGYICGAKIPLRNDNSFRFVYDGRYAENDWKGYVDYDNMPKALNPSRNFIASANNKVDKSFKYYLSYLWEPPSRIMRINELLSADDQSAEKFKAYQQDLYSYHAEEVTPFILNAFKGTSINDPNLGLSIRLLSEWDYTMDKSSQTPSIFLAFYRKLLENIFLDDMGEALFKEFVFVANVPYRTTLQLLRNGSSVWFDDINTPKIEYRDDIIRKSLVDALFELENKLGNEVSDWQWGKLHTVEFKHFFSGVSNLTDALINIGPFPIGGDGTTVFNTEYMLNDPFETKLGPSMRFIFDYGKPGEFYFILPTGQSGHIMSDHYDDMTALWLNGGYLRVITSEEIINNSNLKLLTLTLK